MIDGKKIVIVMPAYNAAATLERTFKEIPFNIVDELILVDDHSSDETQQVAEALGIQHVIRHPKNRGYGGNQKTCYAKALEINADVVVMLHPDYQYTPLLLEAMIYPIARGVYDVMLGARTLGKGALASGMPLYKYISNRLLTFFQNVMLGHKLAEYHTGYRAFSREVLEYLDLEANSDDFVFDNEMLGQIIYANFNIGEVSCPTKYFPEASSINFKRSVKYGLGVLRVSLTYRLHRWNLGKFKVFKNIKRRENKEVVPF